MIIMRFSPGTRSHLQDRPRSQETGGKSLFPQGIAGLTGPHWQAEGLAAAGAVVTAGSGPAHAVFADSGGLTGDVDGDTLANNRDAGGATAGWLEYRCPGSPDRRLAEPSASGACVPAGRGRRSRTSGQAIEDAGERVCDRQHNASFPYQASLRWVSIPRVSACWPISAKEGAVGQEL